MRIKNLIFILIIGIFIQACGETPDIVYKNGKIHTFDQQNSIVEAVAIKDGKILATGKNDEILSKYKTENVVDLEGNVVIPGFIDADGNLIQYSINLSLVDLITAKSIADVKKLMSDRIKLVPKGTWVGGLNFNSLELPLDSLDIDVLNELSGDHNLYIVDIFQNIAWLNSNTYNKLQITTETPNPKDGEIIKFEDGDLAGVLTGEAVRLLETGILENLDKSEMKDLVAKGTQELLRFGITEVQDRYINSNSLEIIRELINEEKFPVRMYAVLTAGENTFNEYLQKGIEVNYKDKLTVRSVSLDYDGSFSNQDAFLTEEYNQEPKLSVPYTNENEIIDIVKAAANKNFQVRIKTVGDKALQSTLNALERVKSEVNLNQNRIIFEHIEFADKNDINKFKEFNIIPSIRPETAMFDYLNIETLVNNKYLSKWALWNSLLSTSGKIISGSDFPFQQINPLIQIYYLTNRQLLDTTINASGGNEKLSVEDAIRSYTVWSAFAAFQEEYKGSLEKNKFADMVVLNEDIFADNKKLLSAKVKYTIINGKIVYTLK